MKHAITLLLAALLLAALFVGCTGMGLKPITPPPGETQPAKTEPAKTEPAKTEAPKTEPAKTEPTRTEAPTAAPATEPARTEPPKTEPDKTEPVVYANPCGTYKLKGINGKSLTEYFTEQFAELLGPDTELDIESLLALSGLSLESLEDMMTITLNEDGTAVSTLRENEETETIEGTWELKNGKILITFDDDPAEFDYVDGQLIADMDGQTMVFAR